MKTLESIREQLKMWQQAERHHFKHLSIARLKIEELKLEYATIDRANAMIDGRHREIPTTGRKRKTNTNTPKNKNVPTTAKLTTLVAKFGRDELLKILTESE